MKNKIFDSSWVVMFCVCLKSLALVWLIIRLSIHLFAFTAFLNFQHAICTRIFLLCMKKKFKKPVPCTSRLTDYVTRTYKHAPDQLPVVEKQLILPHQSPLQDLWGFARRPDSRTFFGLKIKKVSSSSCNLFSDTEPNTCFVRVQSLQQLSCLFAGK